MTEGRRYFSQHPLTHNTRIYGYDVGPVVDNIDDFCFVCNRMAKLYQGIDDGCVDRNRVSKSIGGQWDDKNAGIVRKGCCSFADREITNPKTGNKFYIGFNYAH